MIARFLARWPSDALDRHEMLTSVAEEFASQLRAAGVTVIWAPLADAPPAVLPTGLTKAEQKAARKEERRQFAALGVPARPAAPKSPLARRSTGYRTHS